MQYTVSIANKDFLIRLMLYEEELKVEGNNGDFFQKFSP